MDVSGSRSGPRGGGWGVGLAGALVARGVGQPGVRWRNRQEPVDAALVGFTAPFNLTGAPALSVPCGLSHGLPVGIQLVGRWNDEATILAAGQAVEDRVGRFGRPFE